MSVILDAFFVQPFSGLGKYMECTFSNNSFLFFHTENIVCPILKTIKTLTKIINVLKVPPYFYTKFLQPFNINSLPLFFLEGGKCLLGLGAVMTRTENS